MGRLHSPGTPGCPQRNARAPESWSTCNSRLIHVAGLGGGLHDELPAWVFPGEALKAPEGGFRPSIFQFLERSRIAVVAARANHRRPPQHVHLWALGVED